MSEKVSHDKIKPKGFITCAVIFSGDSDAFSWLFQEAISCNLIISSQN